MAQLVKPHVAEPAQAHYTVTIYNQKIHLFYNTKLKTKKFIQNPNNKDHCFKPIPKSPPESMSQEVPATSPPLTYFAPQSSK